ncbi:hypothetical protein CFC21_039252 [Triticum aestivum]|uniref:Uncharacterized protein n=3 Tax=Triticum aestivum TaxID=4565 RepID=A0A3B6FF92_WHEAT|nr:uncharacterized protein LOC123068343 [Triticum aestivum]KAF7027187.1 hypothetical protein CFC21_039252 [Triticum aestivum]
MAMDDVAFAAGSSSSAMDALAASSSSSSAAPADPSHGWQKVTYAKRSSRKPAAVAPAAAAAPDLGGKPGVFDGLDKRSQERHRAIQAARDATAGYYDDDDDAANAARVPWGSRSSDEGSDSDGAAAKDRAQAEAPKKPKKPKVKKPKVTVADAAALIDAESLAAHLVDISASYENQEGIQLMRFADYFGRAFANVSAAQFPWAKMFKESPMPKMVDVPLSHVPEPVCKTASDWISQRSPDALGEFVLWCIDSIMSELSGPTVGPKGAKKVVQQTPKAQVAIFVVLALTLRRKPDVLINLSPKIVGNSKYLGQEKLPIIAWVINQASQGDLVSGMFCWSHSLFPSVCAKSSVNPQSRDLVLQLLERFVSTPNASKARAMLLNGAVRKGERLVPAGTLDLFMRCTFPVPNARVKATERFEAAYPIIKELALVGTPGSKAVKQASQQLLPLAVKAMQENNAELAKEATDVFIWCLTQSPESYKLWDKLHAENIQASVAVLRKITADWKTLSPKLNSEALKATLKSLKAKNEAALEEAEDSGEKASIKEADKYCKAIIGRLSRGATCLKGSLLVIALAAGAGFMLSPNLDLTADLEKLQAMALELQAMASEYLRSF